MGVGSTAFLYYPGQGNGTTNVTNISVMSADLSGTLTGNITQALSASNATPTLSADLSQTLTADLSEELSANNGC
jgi:hypothetical protein